MVSDLAKYENELPCFWQALEWRQCQYLHTATDLYKKYIQIIVFTYKFTPLKKLLEKKLWGKRTVIIFSFIRMKKYFVYWKGQRHLLWVLQYVRFCNKQNPKVLWSYGYYILWQHVHNYIPRALPWCWTRPPGKRLLPVVRRSRRAFGSPAPSKPPPAWSCEGLMHV